MAEIIGNEGNFEKEVINSELLVIVDFWTSWCGPCKMLEPILEELSKEYENKIKIVRVNAEENANLVSRYKIFAVPTLILFKDGKEIERLVGFHSKDSLNKKIDSVI